MLPNVGKKIAKRQIDEQIVITRMMRDVKTDDKAFVNQITLENPPSLKNIKIDFGEEKPTSNFRSNNSPGSIATEGLIGKSTPSTETLHNRATDEPEFFTNIKTPPSQFNHITNST